MNKILEHSLAPGCPRLSWLAWAVAAWLLLADGATANVLPDTAVCEAAIAAVEGPSGLPAGLLGAIARSESGRRDPLTRRVVPWPWAINAAGEGAYLPTRDAAVGRVRELLTRGIGSVDVGCMQINLQHHPAAFESLEAAFDPRTNVLYAARFLTELHARRGDWPTAIAHYHSADPTRGAEYLRRVGLAWGQPSGTMASVPRMVPAPVAMPTAAQPRPVHQVAMMVAPAAARVRVFTPVALTPSARTGSVLVMLPRRG